jgi:hypothetical protein
MADQVVLRKTSPGPLWVAYKKFMTKIDWEKFITELMEYDKIDNHLDIKLSFNNLNFNARVELPKKLTAEQMVEAVEECVSFIANDFKRQYVNNRRRTVQGREDTDGESDVLRSPPKVSPLS